MVIKNRRTNITRSANFSRVVTKIIKVNKVIKVIKVKVINVKVVKVKVTVAKKKRNKMFFKDSKASNEKNIAKSMTV